MSAYIPAATPAPAPSHRPEVSSRSAINKKESAPVTDDTTAADTDTSNDTDVSFMSSLLASLMGANQSFASTAPVSEASDEPTFVPVKFGGTFNMDPAMLVLPEGVDTSTLLNADGAVSFNTELVSALTPGVPSQPVDGAGMDVDPRLIATGLSPAEMNDLMTKLAAMASTSASGSDAAAPLSEGVSIISFLPDAAETGSVQPVTTDKAVAAQAVAAAAAASTVDDAALAETLALIQPGTTESGDDAEGFDPVEFRLTVKPSRYGSVSLFTPPAAATPVAAPVSGGASATPDTSAAIKGVMQHVGSDASAPAFTSVLTTDATAASLTGTSADPLLSAVPLTGTPLQTASLTNPVTQNITAAQSQPATQAVAALIVRNTQNGSGTQTLAVQLDPPELGKLQLKMRYERGEPLKVHVVLEKADTLAMFQRNAHALENALNQAGVQTDGSSLTFDLAQGDNAFQQAMGQDGSASGQSGAKWAADGTEAPLETSMSPVYTDPKTGLTHYNIYA